MRRHLMPWIESPGDMVIVKLATGPSCSVRGLVRIVNQCHAAATIGSISSAATGRHVVMMTARHLVSVDINARTLLNVVCRAD